jgi:hypothetical protein
MRRLFPLRTGGNRLAHFYMKDQVGAMHVAMGLFRCHPGNRRTLDAYVRAYCVKEVIDYYFDRMGPTPLDFPYWYQPAVPFEI